LARVDWTPTRAAGLARLAAFAPHAGRAYARDRNIDRGPADRSNVSALSPWIRHRLITEHEVIAAVIQRHGFAAAEKFIQEVFWRSYWKGWLEMRPSLLRQFDAQRKTLRETWGQDRRLRHAQEGRTGLACFDAWAQELVALGWLHNHARMWFASIWIFTLRLPWQLGADFFYKHLLDADAASNTLSWRWVAGLHTRGKHYLARAANIRDNTLGRFDPAGQLDEAAPPLSEEAPPPLLQPISPPDEVRQRRVALLFHEDDLYAEDLALPADVAAVGALRPLTVGDLNGPAARFRQGAIDDGLGRAAAHFNVAGEILSADQILAWTKRLGVEEVATPYAPVGLGAWTLDALRDTLARDGVRMVAIKRPLDARAWPLATAGFFKFKEQIPALIAAIGRS
jgi:deoxyribodipyrimidine photo-lyase